MSSKSPCCPQRTLGGPEIITKNKMTEIVEKKEKSEGENLISKPDLEVKAVEQF